MKDKHVRLLIESYLKYKDLFGKPLQSKKKVFDKIAEEFDRTSDVVVTGDQCFRKFKKLESKQKEIEDNASKTGREKKTWKFHKEMENCITGRQPNCKARLYILHFSRYGQLLIWMKDWIQIVVIPRREKDVVPENLKGQ